MPSLAGARGADAQQGEGPAVKGDMRMYDVGW